MNINETVQAAHEAGATRDEIIINLVSEHGLSLNAATKAYAAWAKEAGVSSAPVSHKEGALDQLRELYAENMDGWTAQAVADHVVEFVADYEIAESTARDYCKAFSKEMEVDHPVANPREAIFQWFMDNGTDHVADRDEFMDFAESIGRSKSNANEYWKGYELHLHLAGRA